MDTYVHDTEDMQKEATDKLDTVYSRRT